MQILKACSSSWVSNALHRVVDGSLPIAPSLDVFSHPRRPGASLAVYREAGHLTDLPLIHRDLKYTKS